MPIDLDDLSREVIYKLNKKGYRTVFSCEGKIAKDKTCHSRYPYITFEPKPDNKIIEVLKRSGFSEDIEGDELSKKHGYENQFTMIVLPLINVDLTEEGKKIIWKRTKKEVEKL